MGQCFSCGKEPAQAEENKGAKFVKLASLKLQDAGAKVVATGNEPAPELTAAKALIEEAKSTLDKFDGESNRITEADLQAVQAKVDQAKELVAKAGGSRDVEERIAAAEEALAGALTATKKDEMSNLAADAATAASDGARRLEKVVSSKGAGGRDLTKVTSNVSEAEKALGTVALNEVYGDGTNAEDLKTANATVDSALKALDEEIKTADGELATELKEVKATMEKAAVSLEKRASFKFKSIGAIQRQRLAAPTLSETISMLTEEKNLRGLIDTLQELDKYNTTYDLGATGSIKRIISDYRNDGFHDGQIVYAFCSDLDSAENRLLNRGFAVCETDCEMEGAGWIYVHWLDEDVGCAYETDDDEDDGIYYTEPVYHESREIHHHYHDQEDGIVRAAKVVGAAASVAVATGCCTIM